MPPFESLKSVGESLRFQEAQKEPEELTKGKRELSGILTALEAKEKEIESSSDSAEKKAERYAKIAEVLETQVLPVLQPWLRKYPEKKEGITNAITQIKALIKKYEEKSEELKKSAEKRKEASAETSVGLQETQPEDLKKHIQDQLAIAHKNETSWQEAERIFKRLLTLKGLDSTEVDIDTKYSTGRWDSAKKLILNELQQLKEDYVRTKIKELDLDLNGVNDRPHMGEDNSRGHLAKNILGICARRGVSPLDIGLDGIFTKEENLDYSRLDMGKDDYYAQWNKNKEILQRVEKAADGTREETPENQKKQEEIKRRIESVIELSHDLDVSWQEAEKKILELKDLVEKDPPLGTMKVYVYNVGFGTAKLHIENALRELYWKYVNNKAKERGYDFAGLDAGISDDEKRDRHEFVGKTLAICEQEGVSPLGIDMDQFFSEFEKTKELNNKGVLGDLAEKYSLKDLFIWSNEIYDTNEVEKSLPKIEEALKKLSEEERAGIKYRIVIDHDGREGILATGEEEAVFGIDYKKSVDEIADTLKESAYRSKFSNGLEQLSQEIGIHISYWNDVTYDFKEAEAALPKIKEALNTLSEDEKNILKEYKIVIDYKDKKGRKIGVRGSNEDSAVIAIDYTQSAQEITGTLKAAAVELVPDAK